MFVEWHTELILPFLWIDLTDDELVQWLETATAAKKRYLAGELTEKEALAIIYVPTKKELIDENLVEGTFENIGI